MPSVEKIIELVRFLEISADELLKTGFENRLTEQEKNLLNYFKNCNGGNREIIVNAALPFAYEHTGYAVCQAEYFFLQKTQKKVFGLTDKNIISEKTY